jgi:predicted glycogen debranching enzyme
MTDLVRRVAQPDGGWRNDQLLTREWLVTNGLGAYASSTIAGVNTRSYHGVLVAAQPAPLGRLLMLKQLSERLVFADGRSVTIDDELTDDVGPGGSLATLTEFRLEQGLPVWRYHLDGVEMEKRIFMSQRQNTVYICYRLLSGQEHARLELRPWIHFRTNDNSLRPGAAAGYTLRVMDDRYEILAEGDYPPLRLMPVTRETRFVVDGGSRKDVFLRVEADRGYDPARRLWSPGYFTLEIGAGGIASLVASSEPWNAITSLTPEEALNFELERRQGLLDRANPSLAGSPFEELVFAADQFLVTPAGRMRDAIRAYAAGDQLRSVIAGYHWFADWGRDTMISLEGLTLTTGRETEAAWILRTFHHYVRDGLLPNFFPEGREEGLYHTADATLWFFHALERYVAITGDRETLRSMLPTLHDIIAHHLKGTRYGIGVDGADGLLRQGAEGYQLTWMDAKVDDWVVTPRRGKAVEINALWFNALHVLAGFSEEEGDADAASALREHAEKARLSFNERFWYEDGGYLYDVIDGEHGDDPACRPNQVFAIALPYPILDRDRWKAVLDTVESKLLTPVGLRSLAPGNPSYKEKYFGDLRTRDAAYHQGTVWGWLIGPFIDAWLALHPDDTAGARRCLEGFLPHLSEAGVGTISEIFDAEPPYTPRGCIAQAWSVAEVLRCWVKTAENPAR